MTSVLTDGGYKLVFTPGLQRQSVVANNEPCRGAYLVSSANGVFSVHGNTVYQVDSTGTSVSRGTISTSTGPVYMADNGTQLLIIAAGTNGYTLGISSGSPTLISDGNFPTAPGRCAYLDGYFIVPQLGSAVFYLSQLIDGADWTPVQFASAEASPDYLVACVVTGRQLYNIGYRSIEVWYNTGDPSFPLERINGAYHQIGIVSGATYDDTSIAELNGTIYFIGSADAGGAAIWALNAGGIQRVSTPQIESMLLGYGSGIEWGGVAYNIDGQAFYEISSVAYGKTFLYNITSKAWSRLEVGGACHRISAVAAPSMFVGSGVLAFDRNNGNVYLMTPLFNSENGTAIAPETGTAITRTRTFGPIQAGASRMFHHRIRFVLEIIHDTENTFTLEASLDWTDDDGLTYSTPRTLSKAITAGATGGQRVMLEAFRLGSSRKRYYRLSFVGPSIRAVLESAELEMDVGRN